jgi:nitroreductase
MDIWDAIHQRRAVRDFRPDVVTEPILRRLIEAGSWAPSAMNGQQWRSVVVTDAAVLARISENAKRWTREHDAPALSNEHMRATLNDPNYHLLHSAPALIVVAMPAHVRWDREGCALVAENMMLAATALGLGTCWIGMAEGWLNTLPGRAAIGLPEGFETVAVIAVGYPAAKPPAATRRPPSVIWIGPEQGKIVEDGGPPEFPSPPGLYGGLIAF